MRCCRCTVHSIVNRSQGCQIDLFGAKFQKFGPKQHLLAPKFWFGPLALFWPLDWVLLAAVVEVAVILPLFRWWTCLLVLFRLLLIALALIEDGKFISVYGYTWKMSWSVTIFHHILVLLLSYNCDWGILSFHKLLGMGSYDFVTADKFGKNVWPFFSPLS